MDVFSIDLSIPEIQTIRQSLDLITIAGKDAKFLAALQTKLESELSQIDQMIKSADVKKHQELQKALAAEARKTK